MADKSQLKRWIIEALESMGGSGSVLQVSRHVWETHESELRDSGSMFYTWQYDLRWAAKRLRDDGELAPARGRTAAPWTLMHPGQTST